MPPAMKYLFLWLGGILGVTSRYVLGGWVYSITGASFPYGTLVVNVSGCLAIGFLGTLAEGRWSFSPNLRLFLFIGLLGGYTTFSSYMFESYKLLQDGEVLLALSNLLISVILGFVGLWVGVLLARII
jgi:fluoride exporter